MTSTERDLPVALDHADPADQALPEPSPGPRPTASPQAGPRQASPRESWVDTARGLTIILVVLFHAMRGISGSGLLPRDSVLYLLDFTVYTFHMPAFFFFSGLFVRRALARPPRIFWPGRIRALLWPYALWMTLEIGMLIATSSVSNVGAFHISIAYYLWSPIAPFWFLYSLFCITAVLYAVRRLPDWGMLLLAIVLYGLSYAAYDTAPALVFLTVRGFLFVTLGMIVGPRMTRQLPPLAAAVLAAALFTAVYLVSAPLFLAHSRPEIVLSAGLMGTAGIVLLSQALDRAWLATPLTPLRFLGRISLTLLVVHILGTAGARIVLLHVLHVRDVWVHLAVDTAAGLALGVAVQWLATRAHATSWLGLPDIPVRLSMPVLSRRLVPAPRLGR